MSISSNCQMLVGEFDKISDEVTTVAKAPQKMMKTLNGMVKNAKPDALTVADGAFGTLKTNMVASLGLKGIADSFTDLGTWMGDIQDSFDLIGTSDFSLDDNKCIASILKNPLIEAAIGIDLASMSSMSGGLLTGLDISKITGRLKALAIEQVKANAMAFLEQGMAKMGLGGLIAGSEMGYKKMLRSSGILDGIDLMNGLVKCLGDVTGGADIKAACLTKLDGMMSGLNMTFDENALAIDMGVGDLWAEATGTLPDVKAAITDTVAQGNAIADTITSWDGTSDLDFS